MASELFKMMTGVHMTHVPYRGSGPMLNDLVGGQVQFAFDAIASSIGHIRSGRLRALGVGNETRVDVLADVPAVAEFLPGYEASGIQGLGAPRYTPVEIIDKLNHEINAGLADPSIRARIADLGNTPLALSPATYGKLLAEETEKWGKVIKFAGIKAD
jgi:tripartite-type tricarboxylate transporter receptor subunit TctC